MPALDSSHPTPSGRVLGCPLSFGQVPAGIKAWLANRWFDASTEVTTESTTEITTDITPDITGHTFHLRVQTAADAPYVRDWQQPQQERVLSLLGQQVTVGQRSKQQVRIQVEGTVHRTVVWLELTDQQATLTLDTATLDTANTANTENNHADIDLEVADIDIEAARHGVWRGDVSPYPLVIALHEALRTAGWVPVHGACALPPASPEGAVLFLGASGTGKTTTLVRALQAGWGFVAEDVVWVNAETLAVRSLERGVRLFAEEVGQLEPRLAGADLGELVMGKAFIAKETLAELYRTPMPISTPTLRHVVQLVRDQHKQNQLSTQLSTQPSTWQALNKQHAAVSLWQGLGLPLTAPVQRRVAGWVPHWLAQVEAWQLSLGSDVREVLADGMPSRLEV